MIQRQSPFLPVVGPPINTKYHEFLARYKKDRKVVHSFVEGAEDPSFYRAKVESLLPEAWDLMIDVIGNKDAVLDLYYSFDWTRFSDEQIAFFVDRDLSEFDGSKVPPRKNIYVTDKYAIENHCITWGLCKNALTDICNIRGMSDSEINIVKHLFIQQLKVYRNLMSEVMAWAIVLRREGERPALNDIVLKDLVRMQAGVVQIKIHPGNDLEKYLHAKWKIPISKGRSVAGVLAEFQSKSGDEKFIRGKYEIWFMVKFLNSVHEHAANFCVAHKRPPKMHVNISLSNAIMHLGPRARIPSTLKVFIGATFLAYIRKH